MNQSEKFEYFKTISFRFLSLFFVVVFVGCGLNSYGQGKLLRPSQNHSQTNKPKKSTPKVTVSEPDGYINGHGYIDLGLPSGTKWATCNVGANAPEYCGEYYAWGEVSTSTDYSKNNCEAYGKFIDPIDGNIKYDVATVTWGALWQMPNLTQIEELINNTISRLHDINGITGLIIIGKNGKSIFVPFGGFYREKAWGGQMPLSKDDKFCLWGSTPSTLYDSKDENHDHPYWDSAVALIGRKGTYRLDLERWFFRYFGCNVRPVCR